MVVWQWTEIFNFYFYFLVFREILLLFLKVLTCGYALFVWMGAAVP